MIESGQPSCFGHGRAGAQLEDAAADFARPLTRKGRCQSVDAGQLLRQVGPKVDACYTEPRSPLRGNRGPGLRVTQGEARGPQGAHANAQLPSRLARAENLRGGSAEAPATCRAPPTLHVLGSLRGLAALGTFCVCTGALAAFATAVAAICRRRWICRRNRCHDNAERGDRKQRSHRSANSAHGFLSEVLISTSTGVLISTSTGFLRTTCALLPIAT